MGDALSRFYYEYDEENTQNKNAGGNDCLHPPKQQHFSPIATRTSAAQPEESSSSIPTASNRTAPCRSSNSTMAVFFLKNGGTKKTGDHTSEKQSPLQATSTAADSLPKETLSSSPRTTIVAEQHQTRLRENDLPPLPWPQAPLLLRATSATTRVHAIRRAYPDGAHGTTTGNHNNTSPIFLPMNTGDEHNPWAIDFESDLFRGTMMVRVKGVVAVTAGSSDEERTGATNYFTGKQRQFQVVISGRFLRANIKKSDVLSGQILERPLGPLPGISIVTAVLKLYKTLQPKSHVELGNRQSPYAQAMSPLLALAQTVLVHDDDVNSGDDEPSRQYYYLSRDDELVEPHPSDPRSLYRDASLENGKTYANIDQRRKRRKKLVGTHDADSANNDDKNDDECYFATNRTYTFDMYQHQLHLVDYTLSVAMFYRLPIAPVLNGQPLRILATTVGGGKSDHDGGGTSGAPSTTNTNTNTNTCWSFELWHESLLQMP
jgi:hypothetical protein